MGGGRAEPANDEELTTVEFLRNPVRPYAWGSRTTIPGMLGRPVPAPHPEAELWLGAHPGDPSSIIADNGVARNLLEVIDADPSGQLGARCAELWHGKLPFLLKLLAVEEPLSMQAHPSAEQAAEGYLREEKASIPRDAAHRNYPDPTAKPELVCALSEFHVLSGFRKPARTVELLRAIEIPGLAHYTELLAAQPDASGLRALFTTWLTLPQRILDDLLPRVLDACIVHVQAHGEFDLECRTILELGESHPRDASVLAALLLNRQVLNPGEAMYLPAGNLHLYLHGTAIEILANSDNILRCGLTSKHVDVPELLRVVDFVAADQPVMKGESEQSGVIYRTDAPEFELSRLEWQDGIGWADGSTDDSADDSADVVIDCAGPQVLFCTAGSVRVLPQGAGEVEGKEIELRRGQSLWIAAADPEVRLRPQATGRVQLFRATPGTFPS